MCERERDREQLSECVDRERECVWESVCRRMRERKRKRERERERVST